MVHSREQGHRRTDGHPKKTQRDLAEELGIHPATMNRKLKDPGLFSTGEFGQVVEALDINLQNIESYGSGTN